MQALLVPIVAIPVLRWEAPWETGELETVELEHADGTRSAYAGGWHRDVCPPGARPGEPVTVRVVVEAEGVPRDVEPALLLVDVRDGASVTVDGVEAGRVGTAAGSAANASPVLVRLPRVAFEDGPVELGVRLRSDRPARPSRCAGLDGISFGDAQALETEAELTLARRRLETQRFAAVALAVAAVGLYQLVLYFRRRDPPSLWLGVALTACGVAFSAQMAWRSGLVAVPRFGDWGVDLVLGGMMIAVLRFFDTFFALGWRRAQWAIGAVVLGVKLVGGVVRIVPLPQLVNGALVAALIAVLATALIRRLPESRLLAAAFAPLGASVALGSLRESGVVTMSALAQDLVPTLGLLALVVGLLVAMATRHGRAHDRVRALLEAAERFVPRDFLTALGRDDLAAVKHGDRVRRPMTVVFTDIRGYTGLAERLGVDRTAALVDEVLAAQARCVRTEGGFVDKFIGDAVMALFVEPGAAARAAARMAAATRALGVPIGVGVHAGEVVLGTVGSEERLSCTVLGDAVNLASRVEGLTRHLGATALATAEAVSGLALETRPAGEVQVKGREAPVVLVELLDALPDDERTRRLAERERFAQALAAWRRGDLEAARTVFEALADDPVAGAYAVRCREALARGVPPGWDGVLRMEGK